MKNLQKELQEFDHERFNLHYRNLVDVAITATREDDVLQTLSFLDSLQTFIEKVNEALKKTSDEIHCPLCEAKEKTIQIKQQIISHMEERLQLKDDIITSLKKSEDEALKALNSITGKNLKVCK